MLSSYQELLIIRACTYRAEKAVDDEIKALAAGMHIDENEIRYVWEKANAEDK